MDAEQPHAKQDGVPARRARCSGRTDLRVRVRVRACVCCVCGGTVSRVTGERDGRIRDRLIELTCCVRACQQPSLVPLVPALLLQHLHERDLDGRMSTKQGLVDEI